MFRLLCKCESLTHIRIPLDSPTKICSTLPKLGSFYSRSICSIITDQQQLGDVISSCGGLSDPLRVRCKSSEKPNSVLKFFKKCGFSQTQFKTLVSKHPDILFCDVHKNLKPKFDFLGSVGLSEADVLNMFTAYPRLVGRSLKNHIVPSVHLLITSMGGQREAVSVIKRCPGIFSYNILENLAPNLSTLKNHGIPQSEILRMMTFFMSSKVIAGTKPQWFSKVVSDVMEMGFNPLSSTFGCAVNVMAYCLESTWERKIVFFKNLGFSDEEILYMFKKQPTLFASKDEKIRGVVDFYASKFHWSPSQMSKKTRYLNYSLEKRIIPRCLVFQILLSRNRIRKNVNVTGFLRVTESEFRQRYVIKYKDEIPEVLDAYRGKMKSDECNFDSVAITL